MRQHSEKRLQSIALLAACALFLSTIEYMIPKPVPFLRLGLANAPILIALFIFDVKSLIILIFLKVVGQGLVNGTLFSYIFLFSFGGSFASGLTMIAIKRIAHTRVSIIGISIVGALSSNLVQLLLAGLFVVGENIRLIAPPFLLIGLVSSIALGVLAHLFLQTSTWITRYQVLPGGEG